MKVCEVCKDKGVYTEITFTKDNFIGNQSKEDFDTEKRDWYLEYYNCPKCHGTISKKITRG